MSQIHPSIQQEVSNLELSFLTNVFLFFWQHTCRPCILMNHLSCSLQLNQRGWHCILSHQLVRSCSRQWHFIHNPSLNRHGNILHRSYSSAWSWHLTFHISCLLVITLSLLLGLQQPFCITEDLPMNPASCCMQVDDKSIYHSRLHSPRYLLSLKPPCYHRSIPQICFVFVIGRSLRWDQLCAQSPLDKFTKTFALLLIRRNFYLFYLKFSWWMTWENFHTVLQDPLRNSIDPRYFSTKH